MSIRKIFIFSLVIISSFFTFGKITGFAQNVEAPIQQLSVSVEPSAANFQSELTCNQNNIISQDTAITYTFTYGSYTNFTTAITLEVEWELGTVDGAPVAEIQLLDYVYGTATNGYNLTPPAIDLNSRKITWTIPSFPSSTNNQTVRFELKANDNYKGDKNVTFNTYARVKYNNTVTTSSKNTTYKYNTKKYPTPTPSATTTTSPSSLTTKLLKFNNVYIKSLSSDKAVIGVELNKDASLKAYYGTRTNQLTKSISSLSVNKTSEIIIDNLTPQTTYYVKMSANSGSETIDSDIFSFKTPLKTTLPEINNQSTVITSSNVILFVPDMAEVNKANPFVVIPRKTVYEFRFKLENYQSIEKIQSVLRNSFVLGIAFPEETKAQTLSVGLIETELGVFRGKLETPAKPGIYDLVLRIFNKDGNVTEKTLAKIKVNNRLTVLSENDKKIVEGARVLIKYLNPTTKIFEVIPQEAANINNPSFTDQNGEDNLVLPFGKYQAIVSAIGYDQKTVDFEIGEITGQDYPTIYLKKDYNPISFIQYLFSSTIDLLDTTNKYLNLIGISHRFFELNAISSLVLLIVITILGLRAHTKVSLKEMHWYTFNLFRRNSKKFIRDTIYGQVVNFDTNEKEAGTKVYLIDGEKDEILKMTKTNKLGEFIFKKPILTSYKLLAMKEGFADTEVFELSREKIENTYKFVFSIKEKKREKSFKGFLKEAIHLLFALLIPGLIIICIVSEITLGYSFGFLKVLPFILISIGNAILWVRFYKPVFRNL